jgi:hypothetical protein
MVFDLKIATIGEIMQMEIDQIDFWDHRLYLRHVAKNGRPR